MLSLDERNRALYPLLCPGSHSGSLQHHSQGRNSSPGAAAAQVQQLGLGELQRQELMAELVEIQGINRKVLNFSGTTLSPDEKCQRLLWRDFQQELAALLSLLIQG